MREAPAVGAGAAGPHLLALAHVATSARYAPEEPSTDDAAAAWATEAQLEHALRAHLSWRARTRRRLDPRVLRRELPAVAETGDDTGTDDSLAVVVI